MFLNSTEIHTETSQILHILQTIDIILQCFFFIQSCVVFFTCFYCYRIELQKSYLHSSSKLTIIFYKNISFDPFRSALLIKMLRFLIISSTLSHYAFFIDEL